MLFEDTLHWITLALLPGVGAVKLKALYQQFGAPSKLLSQRDTQLCTAGLSPDFIEWLQHLLQNQLPTEIKRQHDACLEWEQQTGHHLLTFASPDYPPLLFETVDPPPLLFVWGDPQVLALPQLAIVGSRNPTADGRKNARRFASELTLAGYQITSGLALGIDAESHQGALDKQGVTIAVLGTGLAQIYPRHHSSLANMIATTGAVVSEFLPHTGPEPWNFPRRNRIISGLSHGVLVVEAAKRSGSLITARIAAEQGREVFVLPGSIHNPLARGCHQLIRQGAKLVETVNDILEELPALLAWEQNRVVNQAEIILNPKTSVSMSKDAKQLLTYIAYDPATVDVLALRSGLDLPILYTCLMELELKGLISMTSGGYVLSAT